MPTLIDRHGRRDDAWVQLAAIDAAAADASQAEDEAALPAGASVLLPLRRWLHERERWLAHAGAKGVLLEPADDPADIADDLPALSLVAIDFPTFTDGRGYSIARLLRERHGWRGELRAVGDVLRDQLFYMARCGFDTFDLADGVDVEASLAAFADFHDAYQAAFDRDALFTRRLAAGRGNGAPA